MKSVKMIIYIFVSSMVVSFMFTYISNVNTFKDINKKNILSNEVMKAFDIDEKAYNNLINKNINGVGNNGLLKYRLSSKRLESLKKDTKKFVYTELFERIMNEEVENKWKNKNVHKNITNSMYINRGFASVIEKICIKQFGIDDKIKNVINDIYSEVKYFPVAVMEDNKGSYPFGNSWMGARNYGGKRKHEGTDIMYTENKEDVVPIVSISDGVIEKKGWLELGGYRVLVKENNNIKFYYAHLSSYASGIKEGCKVKAGQILGYMGSTGYGKEGTKGKFDVHLHFGMYYKDGKNEIGINPYFLLKMLKFNKLYYK